MPLSTNPHPHVISLRTRVFAKRFVRCARDLPSTVPFIRPVLNWIKGRLGLNCEDDVAIFRKLDAIADEPLLDTILNRSIFTHNFQFEEYDALQKFMETLQRTESLYLDPTINLKARELAWEMGRLC